jgi:hypothetical protein
MFILFTSLGCDLIDMMPQKTPRKLILFDSLHVEDERPKAEYAGLHNEEGAVDDAAPTHSAAHTLSGILVSKLAKPNQTRS